MQACCSARLLLVFCTALHCQWAVRRTGHIPGPLETGRMDGCTMILHAQGALSSGIW